MNTASSYFNKNWQRYLNTLQANTLHHKEMMRELRQFLQLNFSDRPFIFVDAGCGDAQMVAPVLKQFPLEKYLGIDEAKDILRFAATNLKPLKCEKEFIAENMLTAIPNLPTQVDLIFTSYAVHHLSLKEKEEFISHCQQQLKPQGYLLMVDGIRLADQSREEWLDVLQRRMGETQSMSDEELFQRMEHPKTADFPEPIAVFEAIAGKQAWKKFQVLFAQDIFAFMVFAK